MSNKVSVSVGFPTATIMFLIFMTLKLTNHIDWSWWWVTAPLWISLGLVGVFIGFCLFMALITGQLNSRRRW